jgi:hypothetical protein
MNANHHAMAAQGYKAARDALLTAHQGLQALGCADMELYYAARHNERLMEQHRAMAVNIADEQRAPRHP